MKRHTITTEVYNLYCEERDQGETSSIALSNARIRALWSTLESVGLVRLCWYPDDLTVEDIAGDLDDIDALREQAERDGIWVLVGQYRIHPDSDEWIAGDSVGGFVGIDRNGYESDIMAMTVESLRGALRDRCRRCRGRKSRRIRDYLARGCD